MAHYEAYGVADRDSGRAMRHNDIFRIYSMTKPVVSVALLMLYEEGKFQLDDPLDLYLPGFRDVELANRVALNTLQVLQVSAPERM